MSFLTVLVWDFPNAPFLQNPYNGSIIMPPPLIGGALCDDARLMSVCRIHRA